MPLLDVPPPYPTSATDPTVLAVAGAVGLVLVVYLFMRRRSRKGSGR